MVASVSNLWKEKVDVLTSMVKYINIQVFPEGVSKADLDRFFHGVDLYVDGLGFFTFPENRPIASAATLTLPRWKGPSIHTPSP